MNPAVRYPTQLSLALAGLLTLSVVAVGSFTGAASGQTIVQDGDCTFSVAASNEGKNWWELSVSCEFSGWDFIDAQGFGLRGSEHISVPPECEKYGDQEFSGKQRLQSHVCGPAGLGVQSDGHQYLSGAVHLKVNPKAAVPEGSNARVLWVQLYYGSHPGLHGAGGLAAEAEMKIPKKWVEPEPTPTDCPAPADSAERSVGDADTQQTPEDCPPTPSPSESPEPTPTETVPTASPSPSPTGPVLELTKTVDPKKVPDGKPKDFLGHKVVWTVTVRNVGTAAYEGTLVVLDSQPDIWNLYPTKATLDAPAGFSPSGVFFRGSQPMTVRPGYETGIPAWVGTQITEGSNYCALEFAAGKTIPAEGGIGYASTIDDWDGLLPGQVLQSNKAEKLLGSTFIDCRGSGRIEVGEAVVITIEARRQAGDRSADVKVNIATAIWSGGSAKTRATVELEGFNSVAEDIDLIVPLGSPAARPMRAGIGEGLYGTETADELTGTSRTDVLMGHYGDDVLRGLGGIDVISGDVGKDEIFGGGGGDGLIGGSGKDLIDGGDGNDELVGGPDKDRLIGGAGDDRIFARDGEQDVVECGAGEDVAIVDKKDKVKGCEKVRRK